MSNEQDQATDFLDHDPGAPPQVPIQQNLADLDPTLAALAGDLDRPQVSWKPNPGDQLVGRVIGVEMRENEYGVYPLVLLDLPGGPIALVHAFHTILRNAVERAGLDVGDTLAVRYLGRRGKNDMADYTVRVAKAPVAPAAAS